MELLKKIYAYLVDTIQSILIAAAIFLVLYIFVIRPFQVNGESMFPTFENREYVLTNLIGMRLGELQRGDVVVFRAPLDPDKDFIKRVIGLPGDLVMVKNGEVYINDSPLDETAYLRRSVPTYPGNFLKDGVAVTVPSDRYIVMGDNRPNSSDSREWGFVPKDLIIGKSMLVYWPISRIRLIGNPN
jgi:signal peptidase I